MTELLIATRNKGKIKEIRELLKGLDLKITSLLDYPGDMPEIVEDGRTFKENAIKKTVTVSMYTKKLTLGEDSGLQVRALGNRPGVYSSRFSGEGATDRRNNAKLLKMLRGVPLKKRQARYRCLAALSDAHGIIDVVSGSCSGSIALRPAGKNGFGYDPLFYVPKFQKTFGQLPPEVKDRLSHRFRAMKKIRKSLERYLLTSMSSPCKRGASSC